MKRKTKKNICMYIFSYYLTLLEEDELKQNEKLMGIYSKNDIKYIDEYLKFFINNNENPTTFIKKHFIPNFITKLSNFDDDIEKINIVYDVKEFTKKFEEDNLLKKLKKFTKIFFFNIKIFRFKVCFSICKRFF